MALKGVNEDEIDEMIGWAHGRGMDLTLIEMMPLGEIEGARTDQYPAALGRARAACSTVTRWRTSRTGPAARRAMCA